MHGTTEPFIGKTIVDDDLQYRRGLKERAHDKWGWIFIGLVVGVIVGYSLPTVNVEHRNLFAEQRSHILNIIKGTIIGSGVGLVLDCVLSGVVFPKRFRLKHLFIVVALAGGICGIVLGYIAIASVKP